MKDFVFEIHGGIGKNIMATSLIKWVNEKYPKKKITIVSAFPEIFEGNPRIYRNLPTTQSYLFEDYIKGKDYRIGDPYQLEEFYREENKMHCCELYPKAYRFKDYNKNFKNEIFLTKGERLEFAEMIAANNPVVTMQAFGGLLMGPMTRDKIDSGGRDMPGEFAIKIVQKLNVKGIKVVQIRGQNEPQIPGTMQFNLPFRNMISLGIHCKGHIGIDSSFMHAMSAFEKPMLIFWGQTHVDNLGYKYPGVMNIYKPNSMNYRPHVSLPDRAAIFPFKDKNEEDYFSYTDEELDKYLDEFIKSIK